MSTTHQRHVELQGQANFRDLGGYQTVAGLAVNRGQVYRSGRLSALTDTDVAQLRDLGIRTIVSLLTSDDVQAYGPNRLIEDAQEISLPIDSDTATELWKRFSSSGGHTSIPAAMKWSRTSIRLTAAFVTAWASTSKRLVNYEMNCRSSYPGCWSNNFAKPQVEAFYDNNPTG